jgi:protein-disulfide isomerase
MSRRTEIVTNVLLGLLSIVALTLGSLRVKEWLFHAPTPTIGTARVKNWRQFTESGEWLGSPDAKLAIVMFSDFQCPYCRVAAANLEEVQGRRPEVAVLYRHFPLSNHTNAMAAAHASVCAARQGAFKGMHDELFSHQDSLGGEPWARFASAAGVTDTVQFDKCLDDSSVSEEIRRDSVAGIRLGVTGTPTILIRDLRIDGSPSAKELDRYISDALRTGSTKDH